jgi:DnaJ domain
MRDPYEILGIARGATFEEARAAYRRASKKHHPDMGGSHEAMVELNTAYAFILNELKQGARQRQEAPKQERTSGQQDYARREETASAGAHTEESTERNWRNFYRDIDEELEELRRASQDYEERQRAMRKQAWESGQRFTWAKLTWDDLARFIGNLARGGVKGLATLFAALVGVGTILVEANLISALIILGSGIGFFLSLALKNDKGGFMSAGLLMFGVATIWLPALRAALFGWPLATISVLICLALIFKFAREGGIAGLMTGGVLGLFLISVILDNPERRPQVASRPPQPEIPQTQPKPQPAPIPPRPTETTPAPIQTPAPSPPPAPKITRPAPAPPPPAVPPKPPEPRELLAAQGSILKFVAGVPYQLKVRSGLRTRLVANSGTVAFYRGDQRDGECITSLDFSTPAGGTPYLAIDRLIRACDGDAVFQVSDVR